MIPRYSPTYTYRHIFKSIQPNALGNNNEQLASRLSELYGVKHVFLTETARVALYALLKAYNRPGGVLMPAYDCIVVPEAVSYAGYSPVFADIDYSSLSLTKDQIQKALTPDITVVLVTHLLGIPCDLENVIRWLRSQNILIIEDAAPALGAEFNGKLVGRFGDAAIVSFQATKVISAETGGALLTNDDGLAEKVKVVLKDAAVPGGNFSRFIKAVGRRTVTQPWIYGLAQYAYRLLRHEEMYEVVPIEPNMPPDFLADCSSFDSALALAQLDQLAWNLERRRKIAQYYVEALCDHPNLVIPKIAAGGEPAWIQFPLIVDNKWAFYKHMQRHGIDIAWTYRYSCADSYGLKGFDQAQLAAKTVVGLPTYPSLSDKQVRRICNAAVSYHQS